MNVVINLTLSPFQARKLLEYISNGEVEFRDTIFSKPLPLEDEFSVRTSNVFKTIGIGTYYKLVRCTESELLMHKFFGRKSLLETAQHLHAKGLHLGMNDKDIEEYKKNECAGDTKEVA